MIENQCKCSLRTTVLGDGCRYCSPQMYIDKLIEQFDELQITFELLEEATQLQIGAHVMNK